ncbi:MAG TPA: MFS transporter, partial [Solibacterales bacterium]|nr:MFS transporter [Bryobacterales bacterium]
MYGLGNMGYSATVYLGPLAAESLGREAVFEGMAVFCLVAAPLFFALARNAPEERRKAAPGLRLRELAREPMAWLLSAYYALTFGSFVAFSVYLPTLLRDEFGQTPAEAGLRTAGFVILATLARPFGGLLADRMGGARVLSGVFLGVIPFGLLLIGTSPTVFGVGAAGCGVCLGIGSGAVFKLVPQLFPNGTATA